MNAATRRKASARHHPLRARALSGADRPCPPHPPREVGVFQPPVPEVKPTCGVGEREERERNAGGTEPETEPRKTMRAVL